MKSRKLRKKYKEETIRGKAQILGRVNITIWNVLRNKEAWFTEQQTSNESVTQNKELMTEALWDLWGKNPKQQPVINSNLHRAGGEGVTIHHGNKTSWAEIQSPYHKIKKALISRMKWKAVLNVQKCTEINQGSARDPNHTSSSVKPGAGSIRAQADTAASGASSEIFTGDTAHGGWDVPKHFVLFT